MPDDGFNVHHDNYGDVNYALVQQIVKLDGTMDTLNATLNQIGTASGGLATPLWEDQQKAFNTSYDEMKAQLNDHTKSSIQVAETFVDGDRRGARIMTP